MAGIGFRLRALREQDNLLGPVASIGHSALIAAGPWLFTVTALGLISSMSNELATASTIDGFRLVVIYSFAISLVTTAPIILIATRLVGDAVFSRDFNRVQPLFVAAAILSTAAQLPVSLLCYYVIFDLPPATAIAASSCTGIVALIWIALAFCGCVRDHHGITIGFLSGLVIGVGATLMVSRWSFAWDGMIWAFNAGLMIVLSALTSRVFATFPHTSGDLPGAFAAIKAALLRYPALAMSGVVAAVALWIDKWVMWMGPAGISHEMGLIHTPIYDSAMFTACLTIIPALALFVSHVETTFQGSCREYYASIRNHATLEQIERQAVRLKRATFATLGQIAFLQAAISLVVILAAPMIVETTGLLFQQVGILRLGVLGALFQFLFFAATSLLLFFDRHVQFLALQTFFLVLQFSLALLTLEFGPVYYGYGYLAACVISAVLALAVLDHTMENLTFITFILSNARRSQPAFAAIRRLRFLSLKFWSVKKE